VKVVLVVLDGSACELIKHDPLDPVVQVPERDPPVQVYVPATATLSAAAWEALCTVICTSADH